MRVVRPMWFSAVAILLSGVAVGCGGRSTIPAGATQVRVGSGDLSYTATQTGNGYVLDEDSNTKVFQGQLKNGDQMVVKPGQDQIVVGGNNADHTPSLNPNHRYGIYFIPG